MADEQIPIQMQYRKDRALIVPMLPAFAGQQVTTPCVMTTSGKRIANNPAELAGD
jgi:hypothetical protein